MTFKKDKTFDSFQNDEKSYVFEYSPDVFKDGRGSFSEVLKEREVNEELPSWFTKTNWIKQINRSKSGENVVRGCHAQKGPYCQGKLVEAINNTIFDIITDARPNSETFGVSKVYRLDPVLQNKVWVPRGFLHSFVTTDTLNGNEAIFMYYVDNEYNSKSEICVNPLTIIPDVVEGLKEISKKNNQLKKDFSDLFKVFMVKEIINFSEKDKRGLDYSEFCAKIMVEYNNTGRIWYK